MLPFLAAADHLWAPGALAAFGPQAIGTIRRRLEGPDPYGYSKLYRPQLILALRLIVERYSLDAGTMASIAEAVERLLRTPSSTRVIRETLSLIEELDDERFDPLLETLARDEAAARVLLTDPREAPAVMEKAAAILARRVVIR